MITASFDERRSAAVAGAYQYDTGQRLRMFGLPTPKELAEKDDFLSGDMVTVQAQYAFVGDSQTETRLCTFEETCGAWVAAVPDSYLMHHEDVHVYVYVSYGQSEEAGRAKTCYEAVFRPISRPAPGDAVTPDQLNAWDALVQEINLTLSQVNTAASNANAEAAQAHTAAEKANAAAQAASDAAKSAGKAGETVTRAWMEATASAVALEPDEAPTVTLSEEDGVKRLLYGIPRGANGADGPQGPKGDTGPAGVTFTLEGTVLYIDTDEEQV